MTLKIPILAMRPKFSKQSWSSEAQKTPTKHQRTEKSVRVRRILVVQERRGWRGSGEQERRAAVAGRSRPRRRSQRGSQEVGQRKGQEVRKEVRVEVGQWAELEHKMRKKRWSRIIFSSTPQQCRLEESLTISSTTSTASTAIKSKPTARPSSSAP